MNMARCTNNFIIAITRGQESASTYDGHLTGAHAFLQRAGILKDWTVEGQLDRVTMPTLVTRGDSDETLERTAAAMAAAIPSARVITFQGAGSFTHIDACEPYLETVNEFLEKHDA
jgi:pimeloyl-ACP methyl ester carboxylesterase